MRLEEGRRSPWVHDEVAALREAIAISRSAGRNAGAPCHRCGLHRVGEPPPWPELCSLPAPDHLRDGSRPVAYQDSVGTPLKADPKKGSVIPWDGPGRPRVRGGIKVPGFQRRRSGGTLPAVGSQKLFWRDFARFMDGDHSMASRAEKVAEIPSFARPGKAGPLPKCGVRLIERYFAHEHFLRLVADRMPTPAAGKRALGLGASASYELRGGLEMAGGPTAVFRERATELIFAKKIPLGHLIEDDGWARPFHIRLVGGSAAMAEILRDCGNEPHLRATLMQRRRAGDIATVSALLFAHRWGLIKEFGREGL